MEWIAYFAQEIWTHDRYISPFGNARYGTINSKSVAENARDGFGLHIIRDFAKTIRCVIWPVSS